MAQYTYTQLVALWRQAGGSAVTAPFAAAVAMAESAGNSLAVSKNSNGSSDRGLWQINSVHGSLSTTDPVANARAAVQISNNGTNWRPWCVAWSDGRCGGTFLGTGAPVYKFFTGQGSQGNVPAGDAVQTNMPVVPNPWFPGGSIPIPDVGGLNPLNQAGNALQSIGVAVWYYMIGFIGFAMMIVGVVTLVWESKAADLARGLGGKAAMVFPQTRPAGVAIQAKQASKKAEYAAKHATPEPGGKHRAEE